MGDKIQLTVEFEAEEYEESKLAEIGNRHRNEMRASLKLWDSFSSDYKSAMTEIVKFTVANMHGTTEDWLPYCLVESDDGQMIHFRGVISLSDLASAVDNASKATDFANERLRRSLLADINDGKYEDHEDHEDIGNDLDWK